LPRKDVVDGVDLVDEWKESRKIKGRAWLGGIGKVSIITGMEATMMGASDQGVLQRGVCFLGRVRHYRGE
jgi:hypothetical protein